MPAKVIKLESNNALPPVGGGDQYYIPGEIMAAADTVIVVTVADMDKMVNKIQKQVDALKNDIARLKKKTTAAPRRPAGRKKPG